MRYRRSRYDGHGDIRFALYDKPVRAYNFTVAAIKLLKEAQDDLSTAYRELEDYCRLSNDPGATKWFKDQIERLKESHKEVDDARFIISAVPANIKKWDK